MYVVKYGEDYIHEPGSQTACVTKATLSGGDNECGYLDFEMQPSHPLYGELRHRDPNARILVYDGDRLAFEGFVHDVETDFYGTAKVECKGCLAWLDDVVLSEDYSTSEEDGAAVTAPSTADGYFSWLVSYYNDRVEGTRRFEVGVNQAASLARGGTVYRSSSQHPSVGSEIEEKLLKSLGGHLRVRYRGGRRYLDYLAGYSDGSAQRFEFGSNLTDLTVDDDSLDMCTCVVPFAKTGSGKDETELTLEGFEGEEYEGLRVEGRRMWSPSAMAEYGRAEKAVEFDVSTLETLLERAAAFLRSSCSPIRTITASGAVLAAANPSFEPIAVGEYVRVVSEPHGIDTYMLCTAVEIDLHSPENDEYTLGTTYDTLTGQSDPAVERLNASVNRIYETVEPLPDAVKQAALAAGAAVTSSTEEYAVCGSQTEAPQDGWSAKPPERAEGEYLWRRPSTTYGDGTTELGEPVCVTGNDGAAGEDATVLRIDSSRGTVFKSNGVSTVMTVAVYKGAKRITDSEALAEEFGAGAYLQWSWQRMGEDTFGLVGAADPRLSDNGFRFEVGPADVDTKTVFMCALNA